MSKRPILQKIIPKQLNPINVALLYAAFAALWIIASGNLLTFAVDDAALQGHIELAKGLAFVAVTSGLLYLLLKGWHRTLIDPANILNAHIRPLAISRLTLLFAALVLIVPLIGLAIITLYGPKIEREAYANLEAIAKLKTEQIENWLDERQDDGLVLTASTGFVEHVDKFIKQQASSSREIIQKRLNLLRTIHGYDSALLLDTKGQLLFTLGEHDDMPVDLQRLLRQSLTGKQVQRGELYRDDTGNIQLDWVAPIFVADAQGERPIAAVVLRITAQHFLFPLIQAWPTTSPSAETLLVRQDGGSALFINTLRRRDNTALSLRLPLTNPSFPSVAAILSGQAGITKGFDYRHIEVLAAYRPLKGTNWHLIAKIDRHEVLAPLRELVLWVSLVALVAIVAISIALLMLWRQQQRTQNLALLAHKAKTEYQLSIADATLQQSMERTQALIKSALDAIISMDQFGKVITWNPQAEVIFGYTQDQAIGREVAELIVPPIYRDAHRQGIARFIRAGSATIMGNRIEIQGMHSDGSEFPIELAISTLTQNNEQFFSAYIRDISERKQAEEEIRSSKAKLEAALASMNDAVFISDFEGRIINFNDTFATFHRFRSKEECATTFAEYPNFIDVYSTGGELVPLEQWAVPRALRGESATNAEFLLRRKDTDETWVGSYNYAPIRNNDGVIVGSVVTARDITEHKKSENELRIAATAFESHEAMLITDNNQIILKVNQAFTQITGFSAEESIGNTPAMLKSDKQDRQFYDAMWESLNRDKFWQGEIWNRRKNGELYAEWLNISAVTDASGQVSNYVASFADITAIKKSEETIYNLAFYDSLTKLPNRRLLIERLQQALNSSSRHLNYGAILFIDLDNFKELNDIKGYEIGDLLLIEVAKRLKLCARSNDTIACLGGDDFVVVLEDLGIEADQAAVQAESIAEKIRIAISQPFTLQELEYHNASSIGISLFRNHEISVDDLLKHADTAMYQAKQSGRNTIRFFDPATHAAMEARIALEAELRLALPGNQFRLYYQMQVDTTGKILGAEVLIRWQHPERGLVSPAQFIPLTEENGLIVPIGQWVLETACAQIKRWETDANTRHLQLAVNVSALQFRQPDFVEQVCGVLEKIAINPDNLKLELTESLVLEDVNDTITKIQALKKLGIHFSMDDFGTGYSSLAYLSKLPLEQLKIDQSFVYNIDVKASDAVIVQTIIGMAKNLDMEVIAEGVETEQQRDFLQRNGCTRYQGYLFGKPVPLEEFEQLLCNA
ncbi:EAL domain-containing protein [Methylobacter sp.]|uniref:bifunctional diguanylate cyclase/phosphodiesterase n=1 Tax=Methylobacter sp. TaxID=2051955 RepID=UPI0012266A04|nr:EAL domain-containing protein [Methylobacter sp.]TAK60344.1 MAG: EAL domain-containing protein [Methylobacter sp.]